MLCLIVKDGILCAHFWEAFPFHTLRCNFPRYYGRYSAEVSFSVRRSLSTKSQLDLIGQLNTVISFGLVSYKCLSIWLLWQPRIIMGSLSTMQLIFAVLEAPNHINSAPVATRRVMLSVSSTDQTNRTWYYDLDIAVVVACHILLKRGNKMVRVIDQAPWILLIRKGYLITGHISNDGLPELRPSIVVSFRTFWVVPHPYNSEYCLGIPSDIPLEFEGPRTAMVWRSTNVQFGLATVLPIAADLRVTVGFDAVELPTNLEFFRFGEVLHQRAGREVYRGVRMMPVRAPGPLRCTVQGCEQVVAKMIACHHPFGPGDIVMSAYLRPFLGENTSSLHELDAQATIQDSQVHIPEQHKRFPPALERALSPHHLMLISRHSKRGTLLHCLAANPGPKPWLSLRAAQYFLRHLLEGLDHLHQRGWAHQRVALEKALLLQGTTPQSIKVALIDLKQFAIHNSVPSSEDPNGGRSPAQVSETTCESPFTPAEQEEPVCPCPTHSRYLMRPVPAAPVTQRSLCDPQLSAVCTTMQPRTHYCGMCLDCYQVGNVLFTMLTGQYPYRPSVPEEVAEWFAVLRAGTLKDHVLQLVGAERFSVMETAGAMEVLDGLLRYDHGERLTAGAALSMPWLA